MGPTLGLQGLQSPPGLCVKTPRALFPFSASSPLPAGSTQRFLVCFFFFFQDTSQHPCRTPVLSQFQVLPSVSHPRSCVGTPQPLGFILLPLTLRSLAVVVSCPLLKDQMRE